MIPPLWSNIQINRFWMPIPVFLFWPLFALVWIVLGLALTVALIATGGRVSQAGKIWVETWRLLCGLRGTCVDVEQPQVRVRVLII